MRAVLQDLWAQVLMVRLVVVRRRFHCLVLLVVAHLAHSADQWVALIGLEKHLSTALVAMLALLHWLELE